MALEAVAMVYSNVLRDHVNRVSIIFVVIYLKFAKYSNKTSTNFIDQNFVKQITKSTLKVLKLHYNTGCFVISLNNCDIE